jgi:hypothetical protein
VDLKLGNELATMSVYFKVEKVSISPTFCANFAGSIFVLTILRATMCPVGLLPSYRSARWQMAKPPFPSDGPVA